MTSDFEAGDPAGGASGTGTGEVAQAEAVRPITAAPPTQALLKLLPVASGLPAQVRPPRNRPAVAAGAPLLSRLGARLSGAAGSILIHGSLALVTLLSLSGSRMGRGGGIVGTLHPGSEEGTHGYFALVRSEARVDGEVRSVDARVFPERPSDDEAPPEPLEPRSPDDYLKEQEGAPVPVSKPAPLLEGGSHARTGEAYAKLPAAAAPSEPGAPGDGPAGSRGQGSRGNAEVAGTGGNTGGAGDGSVEGIYTPSPEYPPSARRRNIEGVVVIEVEVETDGHCEKARVVQSSGFDALDLAAQRTIGQWKYEPRRGEAPILKTVRFVFRLQ